MWLIITYHMLRFKEKTRENMETYQLLGTSSMAVVAEHQSVGHRQSRTEDIWFTSLYCLRESSTITIAYISTHGVHKTEIMN